MKNKDISETSKFIKLVLTIFIVLTIIVMFFVYMKIDQIATRYSAAEFTILFLGFVIEVLCMFFLLGFIILLWLTFLFEKGNLLTKKFVMGLNAIIALLSVLSILGILFTYGLLNIAHISERFFVIIITGQLVVIILNVIVIKTRKNILDKIKNNINNI